ncbi:MAG TPA: hypothetical protein VLD13_02265 [Gaiellaceae bacterium]|nr:hypothetical protein [Gaiellaceae bacterium]
MEILVGTQALEPRPYLVTVCEHLERLGHEVHVFAAEETSPAEELRVVGTGHRLPLAPDVVYAQDAYAALLLADLYPLTPQLFALHDDWLPPQLAGIVARVVVFDERTAARARAAALPQELVRLRRPVDLGRVVERGALPERPRRARLALQGLSDYRLGLLQRACADAGIEVDGDPDLVIGRRLAVLEAMAAGLPAYVYGDEGGDGWVTPERYELLEADGFSGRAEPGATTFDRLRADLDAYDPAMGPANRELAVAHDARRHAEELVAALGAIEPHPVDAPLRELARLVRLEALASRRAEAATAEAAAAGARRLELERELAQSRQRGDELAARVAELEQALAAAEARVEEAGAHRGRGVRGLLGREGRVPSSEG